MKPSLLISSIAFFSTLCITINAFGNCDPAPVISGPATACTGSTNVYTTDSGRVSYTWTASSELASYGGVIVAGGSISDNSITITWTLPGRVNLYVSVPDLVNGCTLYGNFSSMVNGGQAPFLSEYYGTNQACPGTDNRYYTDADKSNYTWNITGGHFTSSTSAFMVMVIWDAVGSQSISVNYDNPGGCAPTAGPTTMNVNVTTSPVATITGDATVCQMYGGGYSTEMGMLNYVWSSPGATFSLNNWNVGITWSTPGAKTISVSYYNPRCNVTVSTTKDIFVEGTPVPTISGNFDFCYGAGGATYTYSTEPGMAQYYWHIVSGATIIAGGNTTSNFVTFQWNAPPDPLQYPYPAVTTLMLNYVTPNGCYGSSYVEKTITASPITPATFTGPSTACQESVIYFLPSLAYSSYGYTWSVSPDGNLNGSYAGASVVWHTPGTKTVSLSMNIPGTCGVPVTQTVEVLPATIATINGPSTVCAYKPGNVYTTESGKSNYYWRVVNGTINSGIGTNTISVTWDYYSGVNGVVEASYSNPSGCQVGYTTQKVVTINTPPATPSLLGSASVCRNTTQVYTTDAGKSNYVWIIPAGAAIIAGGTTTDNTITLTFTTTGFVQVYWDDPSGCHAYNPGTVAVNVYQRPTPTLSSYPNCQNVPVSYISDYGNSNYVWTHDPSGTVTSGGGPNDYYIYIQWNTAGAKYVGVNYAGIAGCTALSPTVHNFTVLPQTVATLSGPTSSCAGVNNTFTTNGPATAPHTWNSFTYTNQNSRVYTGGGINVFVSYIDAIGCPSTLATMYVAPIANPQTITFPSLGTLPYSSPDISSGATASSGLPISLSSSTTSVVSIVGGLLRINSPGSSNITASVPASGCWAAATPVSQNVTVKATQLIYFNPLPNKTFTDVPFTISASGTSGLPITFSISPADAGVATISGNTVTIHGVGTATINADQPGNATFSAASTVSRTLTVGAGSQTITFGNLSSRTTADAPFTLSATASSGLPVSYTSSNPSVATVSGSVVTLTGVWGYTTITASQPGNASFNPATSVQQTLGVAAGTPTVVFTSPNSGTYGGSISLSVNKGGSTGNVTYSVSNGPGAATVSGGTLNLTGAGTVTVTATVAADNNFLQATATQTITIAKAVPNIAITSSNSGTYGGLIVLGWNTGGSTAYPPHFSVTNNTGSAWIDIYSIMLLTNAGNVLVTLNVDADANYTAASTSQWVTINKANQTITFNSPSVLCGVNSIDLTGYASSTSGLPVSFTSWGPGAADFIYGGNTLVFSSGYPSVSVPVMATQAGNSNYNAAAYVVSNVSYSSAVGVIYQSGDICSNGYMLLTAGAGYGYSWGGPQSYGYGYNTYYVDYYDYSGCYVTASAYVVACIGGGGGGGGGGGDPAQSVRKGSTDADTSEPIDPLAGKFLVYPNPADLELNIHLQEPVKVETDFRLVDILGKEWIRQTLQPGEYEKTLSTEKLVPGTYIIQIMGDQKTNVKKVVIVH